MPKVSGYVRFKAGWSEVGFTDHWGAPYPLGTVYIEASPGEPKSRAVFMATIARGIANKPQVVVRLEEGKVYPFTLEYTVGGTAHGVIAGVDLGILPAPTVELPFMVSNADYYQNWWDVPEHRQAAIFTPLPIAFGVGLIKFIK